MSEREDPLAGRPVAYEVGYGKPPVQSRFKPGQSGNPRGRPKGARNRPPQPKPNEERLAGIILAEAYRTIPIHDGKGQAMIPMAQAVVRSVAVNAAKGSQRAQRLFTQLLAATERENRRNHEALLVGAIEYKMAWERELERRKAFGLTGPEPLPHPDHVMIDLEAGTAQIRGPATKEEKAACDVWTERLQMFEEELRELKALLREPDCADRSEVLKEIANTEQVLTIIRLALQGSRRALNLLQGVVVPEDADGEDAANG